ncbi:MAG: transglycosylase SLT domain-containing protein [Acidobacteriota bacterium]|nr:transglycosylase SLT domain-containing protein [Acidobacteriota bacterium]
MSQILKIFLLLSIFCFVAAAQTYNDATLSRVRQQDTAARIGGKLPALAPAEHLYRAEVYFSNRAFPEAREHAARILESYPNDSTVQRATFILGRSYMWERQYELAISFLDEAARNFPGTKDGREALAFKGACLVRLGKSVEGARAYEQYVVMYPNGERVESSYLNIVDAYREGGKEKEALDWVAKIRQKFPRTPTETNAVFAQLRLQIGKKNWQQAANSADELRRLPFSKSVMTNLDEVTFLKAYALEKSGRKEDAINWYLIIPDNLNSYYGALATERLQNLVKEGEPRRAAVANRQASVRAAAISVLNQYPAPFQADLLREALPRRVDPRFVLAIMKQESSFKTNAKSPAAARGLLQMTVDTAARYTRQAKLNVLQPEDLYKPGINIALGSIYIAELQKEFPNMPEAVAASYNGGEDNAARWLKRADSKEPFIFTTEVGFAETKDYVFKVLTNYRVYRELYTEDLRRK